MAQFHELCMEQPGLAFEARVLCRIQSVHCFISSVNPVCAELFCRSLFGEGQCVECGGGDSISTQVLKLNMGWPSFQVIWEGEPLVMLAAMLGVVET